MSEKSIKPENKLANIEDWHPHFTIKTDSDVRVIPSRFFEDVIDGKREFTDLEEFKPVLRAILSDWMSFNIGGEENDT